jgi:hypothetical protein
MNYRDTDHLRVLIANERKDRLALVAPIVIALGHDVIAREIEVEDVVAVNEASAFEMLRARSRIDNRKLIDLAAAFVDGHRLLPR